MIEPVVEMLTYRRAPSAVSLIRQSFPTPLLEFMIFGQSGIIEFLRSGMTKRYGHERKSKFLVVPGLGDDVVACAEFTFADEGIAHLAYLAVDPKWRGQGIATHLIRTFVADHGEIKFIDLEVFTDNKPARTLYEGLGFTEKSASIWRSRSLPDPRGQVEVGYGTDSLSAQKKFGFSQFGIETGSGRITLGRLGETIIRTYDAEVFDDDALLAAVRAAIPAAKTAFLVDSLTNPYRVSSNHRVLAESIGMRLRLGSDPINSTDS